MVYNDLNLPYLRDKLKLDFAHFSYINGMCSCCYGPSDFPSDYWRNCTIIPFDSINWKNVNYILFKNAINGSGEVNINDKLSDFESIEYKFKDRNLLINLCIELSNICKKFNYEVLVPANENLSIILVNLDCLFDKVNKKRYDRYINLGYNILN